MKRFLVFTLTVLFATSCLFLTNLSAGHDAVSGYGDGMLNFVWGSSGVTTEYDAPYARSMHFANFYNYSGHQGWRAAIPVRYYYILHSEILGPGIDDWTKGRDGHGDVAGRDWWSTSETYSFNMGGRREGRYTIAASTDLTVKADLDGDGNPETQDGWDTSASTEFRIR